MSCLMDAESSLTTRDVMLNSSRHVSLLQATAHVTPWELAVDVGAVRGLWGELGFVEPEKCGNVRISGPAPLRFYSSNFRHSNAIGQKCCHFFCQHTFVEGRCELSSRPSSHLGLHIFCA